MFGGRGDFAKARFHLERCVELYDENETGIVLVPHEQDPRISSLCQLANTLYLAGDAAAASAVHRRYMDLARKLGRPYDLAYALNFAAYYLNISASIKRPCVWPKRRSVFVKPMASGSGI